MTKVQNICFQIVLIFVENIRNEEKLIPISEIYYIHLDEGKPGVSAVI
jgi:hypothetical protein